MFREIFRSPAPTVSEVEGAASPSTPTANAFAPAPSVPDIAAPETPIVDEAARRAAQRKRDLEHNLTGGDR
jgi:hypothetical protein